MRGSRIILGLAAAAVPSTALAAPDDMCRQLTSFHRARFDADVQPAGRRWIEFHWTGFWMNFETEFGKTCRSSPDAASRALCQWLAQHSSTEFLDRLPIRMLTCYGYRFPRFAQWAGWKSHIPILSKGRSLLLEVDFTGTARESGVLRLSSFAADKDEALVELPPFRDLQTPPVPKPH